VLTGQGEELAHRPRADLAQRLEQPLDHRAKQFVRLEVEGRPRQARVAPVQEGGAEFVQPADGPIEEGADGRLGGCVATQLVQVALDDWPWCVPRPYDFLSRGAAASGDYIAGRCNAATLKNTAGEGKNS